MNTFADIVERYGMDVTICGDDGVKAEARAIVQPVLDMGESSRETKTLLGTKDDSGYFAALSPETEIERGDWLRWGNRDFDVLRAEKFYVNGKPSHIEAVLRIREEAYVGGA
jgi:hypothetical protein